jgi:hypothetical protein
MSKKLEKIFNKCISLIDKGYSIKYCLEKYSDCRKELEEYFAAVKELGKLKEVKPDSKYITNSLNKIYSSTETKEIKVPKTDRIMVGAAILKPALIFLAVFVFVGFSFAGTAYASQDSVPGEILYPVKRSTEDVRLLLYPESMKGSLHYKFLNNRVLEAGILLEIGESLDIEIIEKLLEEADSEFRKCKRYGYFNSSSEEDAVKMMEKVRQKYQNRYREKHKEKDGVEEGETKNDSECFREENTGQNNEQGSMEENEESSPGKQSNTEGKHKQQKGKESRN